MKIIKIKQRKRYKFIILLHQLIPQNKKYKTIVKESIFILTIITKTFLLLKDLNYNNKILMISLSIISKDCKDKKKNQKDRNKHIQHREKKNSLGTQKIKAGDQINIPIIKFVKSKVLTKIEKNQIIS